MFYIVEIAENIFDMTKFGLFQYFREKWTGEAVNRIEISMSLMFKMNALNVCKFHLNDPFPS